MGFDTVDSGVAPVARTLLGSISRAMLSIGVDSPASLTESNRAKVATACANEALQRIWYAAKWDWRYRFVFLTMVDKQFLYDLPGDFIQSGARIMRPDDTSVVGFVNYFDLVQAYPALAWPDETVLAAEGGTFEAEMTALIDDDLALGGIPTHYTIIGGKMGLFPIPWSDNVDATDFAEKDRILVGYYGGLKELTTTTDELPIPFELYSCHHWLTTGYLKHFVEYADGAADEQRGERELARQVAMHRLRYNQPNGVGGYTGK